MYRFIHETTEHFYSFYLISCCYCISFLIFSGRERPPAASQPRHLVRFSASIT